MWKVKVIADSINEDDVRLTTLQLKYPRFIHAEFMTHRMFSRNASSSRAIPVEKILKEIKNNPAMPIFWGENKPGMQAEEECENQVRGLYNGFLTDRKTAWHIAKSAAMDAAQHFANAGYHKQIVNRLTEPFQWISVVVTATEWDNFFNLRLHPDAQPEIYKLADMMWNAMQDSEPNLLKSGEWHVPYVEIIPTGWGKENEIRKKISAARCARVSYNKHDGGESSLADDIELADRLLSSGHMSPFEHQATPIDTSSWNNISDIGEDWDDGITHMDTRAELWSGNFRGWIQNRQLL